VVAMLSETYTVYVDGVEHLQVHTSYNSSLTQMVDDVCALIDQKLAECEPAPKKISSLYINPDKLEIKIWTMISNQDPLL
jgi:hypothetical protein